MDIGEKWLVRASNFSKRLASATNRTFSVQHARGLSTTPTADATVHAQAQCWKGLSSHKIAMPQSVAILLCYSGYRVRGVCALQSSSLEDADNLYLGQLVEQ